MKRTLKALAVAAGALIGIAAATSAQAQDTGFVGKQGNQWNIRLRALGVVPQTGNTNINTGNGTYTGQQVSSITSSITPELDFSYFFTPYIAAELIAGTTSATIKSKGALGNQTVGSTWILPPTLTLQVHPFPKERFSPYVGAGVNYTWFYSTSAQSPAFNSFKLSSSFGWALQAGIDVAVSGPWSVNLDVKKIFLSTDARVNLGNTALQANGVAVNPWLIGLGVGYRF